jgi:hypothetical protein
MKRVQGRFYIKESQRAQHVGPKGELVKSCVVTKDFKGDISGTSLCHAARVQRHGDGRSAVCLGLEQMEVEFDGLKGSFWLVYTGDGRPLDRHERLTILEGSGDGDLVRISGAGRVLPGQRFRLDYRLAP